jgi:hypothetical protein
MNEKWHLNNNNKKGYLKIHIIAVNDIKTKKMLSMKVTDTVEHVHDDSKELPGLVDDVIKSDNMIAAAGAIGKLIADDGAYDGNDIFSYLGDNSIPCIKVRKNAITKSMEKSKYLEIYQPLLRKIIYKDGKRIAL